MKELKPRMIQEYRCDFCNKRYRAKHACLKHEDKCFKNPNRNCIVCHNDGLQEVFDGRSWVTKACWACENAAKEGGKSYIPEE